MPQSSVDADDLDFEFINLVGHSFSLLFDTLRFEELLLELCDLLLVSRQISFEQPRLGSFRGLILQQ